MGLFAQPHVRPLTAFLRLGVRGGRRRCGLGCGEMAYGTQKPCGECTRDHGGVTHEHDFQAKAPVQVVHMMYLTDGIGYGKHHDDECRHDNKNSDESHPVGSLAASVKRRESQDHEDGIQDK